MSGPGIGLIRRAREHLGLSLLDAAGLVGVSENSVSRVELQPNPKLNTFLRYGQAMGLELVIAYRTADGKIIE